MDIPTILTDRLCMRPFVDADLDAYHAIVSDPEVMRYIGDGQPADRSDVWRSMAMHLGHWQLRGYGCWAVSLRKTGALIGRIGLYSPEGWPGLEVGWILGRTWHGSGYATEGARASLRYAFDVVQATRVISLIQPANEPSIRVAQRIGESRIGTEWLRGKEVSVYAIERPTEAGPG